MAGKVQKIAPPALPWATNDYDRNAEDEYSNILRLFFNRLVNAINALLGGQGGQFIDSPNGLFYCLNTQTIATVDTATEICFENTYLSNGVTVDESLITCEVPGVYNFQFSGQLESTNSSAKDIQFWIRRNGTDIGYSAHTYTMSGNNNKFAVTWNFNIDMQTEDTLQMIWASEDINVALTPETPSSPYPGTPSAVLAVTFVSALPETLPTPP